MRKKFLTATMLFCFAALAVLAVVADLTGKWAGKLQFNGQDLALTYNFTVNGEKLTGTAESPYGVSNIENGKYKDNQFSFTTNVQGTDIAQNGKFYGDSVGLDINVNGEIYHAQLKRAEK